MTYIDNSTLIQRDEYLDVIENYIDKPIIKVLIGMRRVGKSAIMKLLINRLLRKNIPASNIIYLTPSQEYSRLL